METTQNIKNDNQQNNQVEDHDNQYKKYYKVKYTTKSGRIIYYVYPSKYTCKGRGKEIFKNIADNYSDILKDDTLTNSDKAYEIYKKLDIENRKKITVDKIRSFIYRWEYKNITSKI